MPRFLVATDPNLGEALKANVVSFFSRMGRVPGGRLEDRRDGIRISSGVPFALFNWVFQARDSGSEAEDPVDSTLEYFGEANLPFLWGIFPGDRPIQLREKLWNRGFTEEAVPAMIVDLDTLPAAPSSAGLAVQSIRTPEELRVFARVLNAGDFQEAEAVERAIPGLLQPSFSTVVEEPHLRCFVGYLGGDPVASSARLLSDGVVGIYGVATVPEARRRGFGAALTRAALEDARACGYRTGILLSSRLGQPVYRRLGFWELYRVCQFEVPARIGPLSAAADQSEGAGRQMSVGNRPTCPN